MSSGTGGMAGGIDDIGGGEVDEMAGGERQASEGGAWGQGGQEDTPAGSFGEDDLKASAESEAPAPQPVTPVWLGDEPPEGKSNWTKWALMHGMDEDDCVAAGVNPSTVRICAQELEKDGYRRRPKKPKDADLAVYKGAGRGGPIRVYPQGSPPEALINAIELPIDSNEAKIFEKGLKTGASLLVLGVRVAQELSAIGVQQAKPIMDMARSMREGEAAAAKSAAQDAAQEAATKMGGVFGPHLSQMEAQIAGLASTVQSGGGQQDPMRAMLVRTIEPMFKQMMGMFTSRMAPQAPPGQNQPAVDSQQPDLAGWSIESG